MLRNWHDTGCGNISERIVITFKLTSDQDMKNIYGALY